MIFEVRITEQAEAELNEAYEWIARDSSERALRWLNGIKQASESLSRNPERCPLAPESKEIESDIRQLLYGKYRMLFIIRDHMVYLLHIRHGARQPLQGADL